MNERERFRRLFLGEAVDRPPLLEEGVREDVIDLWRAQGMPADKTHLELFGLTPHENIGPDIRFRARYNGRIMSLSAHEYRCAFDVSRRRFPGGWIETVRRLECRDHIVCVWASRGFFQALGANDWPTVEEVLIAVRKDPARIRTRLEIYGDFCASMLEMTLRDVDPEFVYLSEPISDSRSPLISPQSFEEFMIPVYKKIVAAATSNGCSEILLSTYGNTAMLFPALIEAGISILWISEATESPELEYRNLRSRYGSGLGLIGGIPLSLLRSKSPDRIIKQLKEFVPPLLGSGRYIPLAGGRIREEIPWSIYKCYRETLNEIVTLPA